MNFIGKGEKSHHMFSLQASTILKLFNAIQKTNQVSKSQCPLAAVWVGGKSLQWKEAGDTSVLAPHLAQRAVVGVGEDSVGEG